MAIEVEILKDAATGHVFWLRSRVHARKLGLSGIAYILSGYTAMNYLWGAPTAPKTFRTGY